MKLLSCLRTALCLLGLLAMPAAAAYPEKPINMIIAFTAGGSSDVQARIMQKYWNKYAPQPWVFVYKPGAGGIIGFTEIAKARPDGYTIGGLNVPHIILQPLAQNAQFTPDSFKYICQVVNDPQCIAVRKDSPYQSTSEIIAAARKNPGKIRVGLVGPLSGHHLMFLDYGKKYPDAKLTSVFYKGAADQNAALLGGEIDMIFGNINDVIAFHRRVPGAQCRHRKAQWLPARRPDAARSGHRHGVRHPPLFCRAQGHQARRARRFAGALQEDLRRS